MRHRGGYTHTQVRVGRCTHTTRSRVDEQSVVAPATPCQTAAGRPPARPRAHTPMHACMSARAQGGGEGRAATQAPAHAANRTAYGGAHSGPWCSSAKCHTDPWVAEGPTGHLRSCAGQGGQRGAAAKALLRAALPHTAPHTRARRGRVALGASHNTSG